MRLNGGFWQDVEDIVKDTERSVCISLGYVWQLRKALVRAAELEAGIRARKSL
jgi:hypothetical protein